MSDELHKYPGNLKHHKVDAPKREPLLSDKDLLQSESREPHFEVRNIYEEARAKDAELIDELTQKLDDANRLAQNWGLQVAKDAELIQTLLDALCLHIVSIEAQKADLEKAQDAIAAARAAGFKPSRQ